VAIAADGGTREPVSGSLTSIGLEFVDTELEASLRATLAEV
jgi:hypothetical protein